MKLPQLPEPGDQMNDFFAPDQMHDYARTAVKAALEEAAKVCWERQQPLLPKVVTDLVAMEVCLALNQCAAAIRKLIGEIE